MGGGGGGTQTVTKELPAWAQPYAESYLNSGMQALQEPVQQFQGMRVAPVNDAQQAALSMVEGRALGGAPDEIAARQQATNTLTGGYLNANPWLADPYTGAAIEQNAQSMGRGYAVGTAAQLDAAAARARALGGSGYQQAVGQNETNLASAIGNMANQYQLARTNMGATDWSNERQRMAAMVPYGFSGSQLDYNNANQLMNAGSFMQGQTQKTLDQIYSDYMTQANAPFAQIDRIGNLLGMAVGNTGVSTQMQNPGALGNLTQLAGAGLGLYGLGSGMGLFK
jgi:hypothetical protein